MVSNLLKSLRSYSSRLERKLRRTWTRFAGSELSWLAPAETTSEQSYLAALQSAAPAERWQAAAGLGRNPMRSPEAITALVMALGDDEEFVRWHAADALAHQEQGLVFPALVSALAATEPLRRAGAVEALGKLGGEAAGLTLIKHASDSDARVRIAVAVALGNLKDPTSASKLLPLLHDRDEDVIRAAARALGQIGTPVAAPFLAEALAAPGQPVLVRRALAAALIYASHPDTQPQLLAALGDEDPQVRAYAARALGQVGTEMAIEPLSELMSDKSSLIRGTVSDRATRAIDLLERRGRRHGQTGAAPPAEEG
jgi:HEAT repeat protein